MTTLIKQACDQGIVTLTFNRPDKHNVLSTRLLVELKQILLSIYNQTDFSIRGMILTGAGDKAFVAGADIAEMSKMSPPEGEAFAAQGQEITELLEAMPFPVIACVNGYALGGGCEMAMACDFIYCTQNARFGQPEVSLGLTPCFGGCIRLRRYVSVGYTRELIYTGRMIPPDEAQRIGLINRVFENKTSMLEGAKETLLLCQQKSPVAISICKNVIQRSFGQPTRPALDTEKAGFRLAFMSLDMQEGTNAFLSKRKPVFPRQ